MAGKATEIGRGDKEATSLDCDPREEADAYHTAIHEAGHAVAAVVLGIGLESVSIKKRWMPDGKVAGGMADFGDIDGRKYVGAGREAIMPYLTCVVAGPLAEFLVDPTIMNGIGHLDDFEKLRVFAYLALSETPQVDGQPLVIDEEDVASKRGQMADLARACFDRAKKLLDENGEAVEAVACQLVDRHELRGDEVVAIVTSFKATSPATAIPGA